MNAAVLAFAVALLALLVPQAAQAHGGKAHHEPAVQTQAPQPPQPVVPEIHNWSPACPDTPGHVCGCGNLALCEGSPKPAVVAPHAGELTVALAGRLHRIGGATFVLPSAAYARARPRAPPASS